MCGLLQWQSHCWKEKGLTAFSSGLNLGQPIDKCRALRKSSSLWEWPRAPEWRSGPCGNSTDVTLDCRAMGQSVVREMGRVDITRSALMSGRGRQGERSLNLLPTRLCSSQAKSSIEQQLEKGWPDADEIRQSDCVWGAALLLMVCFHKAV